MASSSRLHLRNPASTERVDSVDAETSLIRAVYLDSKAELLAQTKRLVDAAMEPLDRATASKLLHLCCNFDSAECASALLGGELGTIPLVNELDDSGKSPLHTAAAAHAARCVEVLLKKDARTDLRTKDGQARLALELSLCDSRMDVHWNLDDFSIEDLVSYMTEKDLSAVKLLSDNTKDTSEVAYAYAVQGRVAALTALLIVAADKVNDSILELRDSESGYKEKVTIYECLIREALAVGRTTTPLRAAKRTSTATESEVLDKRKILLREIELLQLFGAVAQSGGVDKKVTSPLIHAAQGGDEAVIQLLLKTNIDVNEADADGNSAIHWILKLSILLCPQQIKILLLLLEHGARVSQRNKLGLTAFHIAAGNGNSEALEVLLLEDQDGVHYQTEMKETPLFFAAKNESTDCAELLLTWGANSEILNLRQRAIDLATSQDMRYILLNLSTDSLINHAFPYQHKCTSLELTDEGTTTERNVNSSTKAEVCKYFDSHRGCVRGAKCFYAHCEEESQKVKEGADQSHSSATKQLKRKIFVGGLPPSVDSDVLGKFFEEKFGSVEYATVILTGIENKIQSRGFGFVTFREEKSVSAAVQAHYITMRGKQVKIKSLNPKLVLASESEKMSPQQQEQEKIFQYQLPLQKSNEKIMEGDNPEQGSWADRLVLRQLKACFIQPQASITKSSEDPGTPTWLKVFNKWFPEFLQDLSKHPKYALSSLKTDFRAKFGLEMDHSSLGYSKLSDFLKCFSELCTVEILPICKHGPPTHMILQPKFPISQCRFLHTLRTPHTLSSSAMIENGGDSKCLLDLSTGIGSKSKCIQDHSKCFQDLLADDGGDSTCLQNLSIDSSSGTKCLQDLSLDFGVDSKCIQDVSICNAGEKFGLNVTSSRAEKPSCRYLEVSSAEDKSHSVCPRFSQLLKPYPLHHGHIREAKGTTLIAGKLEKAGAVIVGFDSRASLGESIDTELKRKFEKISPNILGIGAGCAYDMEKTLTHMKHSVPKRIFNHPEVIHEVGKYGVNRTQRSNVAESTVTACYVVGIQSNRPVIYEINDNYDGILGRRVITLKACGSLITMGSGAAYAAQELVDVFRNHPEGPPIQIAVQKFQLALLQSGLSDCYSGGIFTVVYVDSLGMIRISSMTVIELYIQFYDRFRGIEDRTAFMFYHKVDKKRLKKRLGRVESTGHSLTLLDGGCQMLKSNGEIQRREIYAHRVLFRTNEQARRFLEQAQPFPHPLPFTSSRDLRVFRIKGKKVYIARQSIELLRSLIIADSLRSPIFLD